MPGNVPTGLAWYKTFGYQLRPAAKPNGLLIVLSGRLRNQNDKVVLEGGATVLLRTNNDT